MTGFSHYLLLWLSYANKSLLNLFLYLGVKTKSEQYIRTQKLLNLKSYLSNCFTITTTIYLNKAVSRISAAFFGSAAVFGHKQKLRYSIRV